MTVFSFSGILIKEEKGFSSLCPELDMASVGETLDEAKKMLLEAATLHLEGAIEDGLPYLPPIPSEEDPRHISSETVEEVFRFKVDVAVHAYA